ncbi:DegQ family serine endoprotease [Caenispirillum bisanense]|uniref:Serine protease Do n=1 Tax=Caenispirillum bisanense TaxID=414052 RepID=A0A286G070_9PROT|nr:DegQ family serine endoprotease [Caenispirillum bisanense]SOD88858.1 serine protease Do [Caenispirillum bisanense]
MPQGWVKGIVAALACAAALVTGGVATAQQEEPARVVPQDRAEISLSFAPVVKAVTPAVVNIYTKTVVQQRQPVSPLFNDPFFRRFFGDQLLGQPREQVQNSLGSGVIVRADGIVVTNDHVVKNATEITVVLSDRREFAAEVVGTDERTDLAVLRLKTDGADLPVLPLGDSDLLEVGDLVLAVGNPFGVGQTVTMGIVSALSRTTGGGQADYRSFIQTDAAINPGNSGGALVDSAGNLIGVNTAIYSRDGGSVGIGFAIPSDLVRVVVDSLLSDGKAVRPWFGAAGQGVTADIAQSLGLPRPAGVLVNGLYPGSPAEKAGLRIGDVITAMDGHPVADPSELRYRIVTAPVGGTARMSVLRKGAPLDVTVALIAPPEDPPRNVTRLDDRAGPFGGAEVANINPALAEEMGLPGLQRGVVIQRLLRGGVAAQVGFRPGDVVTRVNDSDTLTIDALQAAVRKADTWRITFTRAGRSTTVLLGR